MRTDHVFSGAREDAKGKRLRSQRKEVVADVYDYFEELNRCKRTQALLKQTADATGISCASIKRLRKEKAFSVFLLC